MKQLDLETAFQLKGNNSNNNNKKLFYLKNPKKPLDPGSLGGSGLLCCRGGTTSPGKLCSNLESVRETGRQRKEIGPEAP